MEFSYKAVDADGQIIEGQESGLSYADVILRLKQKGYTVLDLREEKEVDAADSSETSSQSFSFEPFGVPKSQVVTFTRQLSELIEAGIPIVQSITTLRRYTRSQKFKAILGAVASDILTGNSIHEAMAKHPEVFDKLYVSIIKAGEVSGNLLTMIERLADYLETQEELRGKIKSALTYPLFILGFSALLVYAMVSYLLPQFEPIWQQSGLDLNQYPITVMLMKISSMTHSFADEAILVLFLGLLFWVFKTLLQTPEGIRTRDSALLKIFYLGDLITLSVMVRVASTLSTLLDAGLPLTQALELTGDISGNVVVKEALLRVSESVQKGDDLTAAFKKFKVFPPLMVQMIAIGEKSGRLQKMLSRISVYYQRQLDNAIKGISSLIEPVTMVMVGGVVFIFVLGVFMPIMGIVVALQNKM